MTARMLSRGLSSVGLGPRSPAPPSDVGELGFFGPSPLIDFCNQIRRTGTLPSAITLARDRDTLFSRKVSLFRRLRDVRLRKGESSAASQIDSARSLLFREGPLCYRRGRHFGALHFREGNQNRFGPTESSISKVPLLRWAPLLDPCRATSCRQPDAAKELESPPPRRAPPLLLEDMWGLACRAGLGLLSLAHPRR